MSEACPLFCGVPLVLLTSTGRECLFPACLETLGINLVSIMRLFCPIQGHATVSEVVTVV